MEILRFKLIFVEPSLCHLCGFGYLSEMLAFDIETKGLNPKVHPVTVVCTEDFFTGERKAYEFARHAAEPDMKKQLTEELVQAFDAASSLCAFNGVRFDLPFLEKALGIPRATVAQWVLKTTDILEQSRLRFKTTFSLNLLCETNGIPVKISSGLAAVQMANDGNFNDLKEYCQDDTAILCRLYTMRHITLPKLNQQQDLQQWAHTNLYEPQQSLVLEASADPDTHTDTPTDMDTDKDTDMAGGGVATAGEMLDDLIAQLSTSMETAGGPPSTHGEALAERRRILDSLYRLRDKYQAEQEQIYSFQTRAQQRASRQSLE